MNFEKIIGNRRTKELLNNNIRTNTILHSYLFVGNSGIGKSLFAKEFAKAILCIEKEKICGSCKSCISFEDANHPDFMQIEAENEIIKIEKVRYMQEKIAEKPIISDKKVYIINDADYMTKEAQNCLLKTLEEPPKYAVIILIATNESKLLATIKSRCMKIPFENIENLELEKYMEEKLLIDNSKEKVELCNGSIGKAIKLKENEDIYLQIDNILNNFKKMDLIDLLNSSEVIYKSKENIQEILDYIIIKLFNNKDLKSINCIKYVEDTRKRLLANSNYDMCIDSFLMKSWEEFNEKYNRC